MYKPERETEILSFWKENKIFEKSLEQTKDDEPFVFYDGPPFATGTPHFGHVLPSTLKDIIPRYQTMKGRYVARKWGWDCHGLPVENIVEKDLGLKTKKDILDIGIDTFNKAARETVLRYAEEWRNIVPRLGRWVDMENDYRTMDVEYTDKVWDAFSKLNSKGLVYEGFKVMYVCPRCETSLSNFEVNQGYKDITDISVYVKFALVEEKNTFMLAWTTTPWTLPGNMALAVGADMEYVKVKIKEEFLILSKNRVAQVLKDQEYEVVEELKGSVLVGKTYVPVFEIYKDKGDFKIYAAGFVTDVDGTGVVHVAPGFGDDDLRLSQAHNIPFVQHVGMNGIMKEETGELAGLQAKPKSDEKDGHQATDVEIIKYLAKNDVLFAKEKVVHSYPHCWRCETPLLNFATTSWFVKVTDIKDKLVEENKKVRWVPKEIGENRFGRWLEGARDWAISRARFWGAAIPIWKSADGKKIECVSSIDDLKTRLRRNTYTAMRHGESEHNVKGILSSLADSPYHITEKGKKEAIESAKGLKDIDVIFASPLQRTRDTAELVKKTLGLDAEIIFDERIHEFGVGEYEGRLRADYLAYYAAHHTPSVLDFEVPKGESYRNIRNRVSEFLYDIDQKYEGKHILIITHEGIVKMLQAVALGGREKDVAHIWNTENVLTGTHRTIDFVALPKNENNEIDLHRPFIDNVVFYSTNEKGEKIEMRRVTDVFDCWFESGSMPFASKQGGYPADFIAEGLDQTRGWFYSLLVLGTALFEKSPYQNVVVNGLILAEDGKKMSKRLNNYPPLLPTIEKYGVDALRYFLAASPSVKAEDTAFSEKYLDEVIKKHFNRLYNVIALFEMYKETAADFGIVSDHVLDVWITTLLQKTIETMTYHLDRYEFDKATRQIGDFIEDFSTWYIRRSRDRFKSDDTEDRNKALSTTRYVLIEFSKLMAPFIPFLSEDVYQNFTKEKESVHLEKWPEYELPTDADLLLSRMSEVRNIVSLALEARAKGNVKVRQPLSRLMLRTDEKGISEDEAYISLIKDEVNVKEVILDSAIDDDVMLDITMSAELIKEGVARELMRFVQDLRKKAGLSPKDSIVLTVDTDEKGKEIIASYRDELMKTAKIADFLLENVEEGETLSVEDISFKIGIKKL